MPLLAEKCRLSSFRSYTFANAIWWLVRRVAAHTLYILATVLQSHKNQAGVQHFQFDMAPSTLGAATLCISHSISNSRPSRIICYQNKQGLQHSTLRVCYSCRLPGLLLGTEAHIMKPNSADFSFPFFMSSLLIVPFICAFEPGCPMCHLWLPNLDCEAFDWLLDGHEYIVMLHIPRAIVPQTLHSLL